MITYLLDSVFVKNAGNVVVRSNPQSRKTKGKFSPQHEYCLFYGKDEKAMSRSIGVTVDKLKRYPLKNEQGNYSWMTFIRAGNNDKREDRPKLYYPIAVNRNNELRILDMEWNPSKGEYDLLEQPREDETLVYPNRVIDGNVIEKNWQRGYERVKKEIPLNEYRVRRTEEGISIDFKTRMDDEAMPTTWWDKGEYASANYAPIELKSLFGDNPFDFAKAIGLVSDAIIASGGNSPDSIILDFFAGSGTTAHAVINLNREDGESGKRKYILCEMGDYFDTVTKPRVEKVVYSKDWKDGKPVSRQGSSHCFKYMRLEQYEDTLNNIVLQPVKIDKQNAEFYGGYMMGYMLDTETRDSLFSLRWFRNPWAMKLRITRQNETREEAVDLVETFNYLIGLRVSSQLYPNDGICTVEGTTRRGERTLIIWRDCDKISNADLNDFFTRQAYSTRDTEFDRIYVNGDNNLENLRRDEETWKVVLTEEEFQRRMFEEC